MAMDSIRHEAIERLNAALSDGSEAGVLSALNDLVALHGRLQLIEASGLDYSDLFVTPSPEAVRKLLGSLRAAQ